MVPRISPIPQRAARQQWQFSQSAPTLYRATDHGPRSIKREHRQKHPARPLPLGTASQKCSTRDGTARAPADQGELRCQLSSVRSRRRRWCSWRSTGQTEMQRQISLALQSSARRGSMGQHRAGFRTGSVLTVRSPTRATSPATKRRFRSFIGGTPASTPRTAEPNFPIALSRSPARRKRSRYKAMRRDTSTLMCRRLKSMTSRRTLTAP